MKLKAIYVCTDCNAQSPKWGGQCLECGSWNSLVEDVVNIGKKEKQFTAVAQRES